MLDGSIYLIVLIGPASRHYSGPSSEQIPPFPDQDGFDSTSTGTAIYPGLSPSLCLYSLLQRSCP